MNRNRFNLNQFDEWRDAQAKLVELQQAKAAAESRLNQLGGKLHAAQESSRLDAAADALLEGRDLPDLTQLNAELEDARRRRRVVTRAIEKHRDAMSRLAQELGKQIAALARPDYEALMKQTAIKLEELADLVRREKQLREDLNDSGAGWTSYLLPRPLLALGDPDESTSRFGYWFREAREAGYIEDRESKAA